jgi:hypothetical protein
MDESAKTLAEKHKARRMAGRRLLDLTSENPADAEATPAETTPAEATPVGVTQEETTPVETMSGEATPASPLPDAPPPDASLPDVASPETLPSDAFLPTMPVDAAQEETLPVETTPVEAAQEEMLPVETTPASLLPDVTLPEAPPPDTAPQMTLLEYVRTTSRQGWQGVRRLPSRFTGWAQSVRQRRADRRAADRGPSQPPPGGEPPHRLQRAWAASRPFLWRGRVGPAFWTVASSLSLVVNIILIVILILLGRQLFVQKKTVVSDQLIGGLYDNFVLMDQAHIQTTITVSDTIQVIDTIPVVFDLPLDQKTVVVLTKDTPVKNATIYLNNTAVPLDLILREGTELSIQLDMTVPVEQTIPVVLNVPINLQVPVDIPLDQTQLHQPFVGLQQVVAPYRQLLGDLPDSWGTVCKGPLKLACSVLKFK